MDFEQALRAELITIPFTKVSALNAREGTKTPYLVYVTNPGSPDRTLDGNLTTGDNSCELHILHDSYPNLKSITAQVTSLLDTFQQREIGGGFFVQSAHYDKVQEQYVPDLLQYLCVINLTVRY